MSKKPCPLGWDNSCVLRNENYCFNFWGCWAWTRPWPLPLIRVSRYIAISDMLTFDSPYWLVQIRALYPPINSEDVLVQRNWEEYLASYGYAEAEPLPIPKRPFDKPFFLRKEDRANWLRG